MISAIQSQIEQAPADTRNSKHYVITTSLSAVPSSGWETETRSRGLRSGYLLRWQLLTPSHACCFGGYYGYPGYAYYPYEALAVHIRTAGTIAPTGVVAVTTERIIGADGGTGTDGA